jgi:hypothetical protein
MSFPTRSRFGSFGFPSGTLALMLVTALPGVLTTTAEAQVSRPIRVSNVDVLNDMLNEPYNQSKNSGAITGTNAQLTFDVPEGSRLVVEAITVNLSVLSGEKGAVSVEIPGSFVFLALESPGGVAGFFEDFRGTHPIKLRVDGSTATDEIKFQFSRRVPTGSWFVNASVHGYLVPLPTP